MKLRRGSKRIVLVAMTIIIGIIFFALLTGYFKYISKEDISWDAMSKYSKEEIIPENNIKDVYENTDSQKYRLIWEDEFDNEDLDFKKWSCVKKTNSDLNELQAYLAENVKISDRVLYLTAKKENYGDKQYTSGMIETYNKFNFKYGKIEVCVSIPKGKGLFPAIWLLSESGIFEVDVLEALGQDASLIYGVNHYWIEGKKYKTYSTVRIDKPEKFHIYSLEWNEDELIWAVDNKVFHETNKGVPQEEMYILINLAVGGIWPGDPDQTTQFPNYMAIDYIRVYEYIEKDIQEVQ